MRTTPTVGPLAEWLLHRDFQLTQRPGAQLRMNNARRAYPLLSEGFHNLLVQAQVRIDTRLAASTRARHDYIARAWRWLQNQGVPVSAEGILVLVEWLAIGVLPSTAHTYGVTVRTMYPHLATQALDHWIKSLAKAAAAKPQNQATPLTKEEIEEALAHLPLGPRWALWLAWKTASRWDEVMRLLTDSFEFLSPTEVLVKFGGETKASGEHPFREEMYPMVEDPRVTQFRNHLATLRPGSPITTWKTRDITAALRKILGKDHGASSIKRGALTLLALLAVEGKCDPRLIPIMAKHKRPNPLFPDMTVRYLNNLVAVSRLVGTQSATRLL